MALVGDKAHGSDNLSEAAWYFLRRIVRFIHTGPDHRGEVTCCKLVEPDK